MNAATLAYIRQHPDDTAAEIVASLAADFATARNIDRKTLAAHLLATGLTLRFRTARDNQDVPEQIRGALYLLNDIVTSGIDYVETTSPVHGATMAQLLGGLQAAGLVSADEAAALIGLGGGYRYERPNEAQVEDARALITLEAEEAALTVWVEEARQRVEQALNAFRTAVQEGRTDVAAPDHAALVAAFEGA